MNYKLVINPVDVEDVPNFLSFINMNTAKSYEVRYSHKYFTLFKKSKVSNYYTLKFCDSASSGDKIKIFPYKDIALLKSKSSDIGLEEKWQDDILIHLREFSKREFTALARQIIYLLILTAIFLFQCKMSASVYTFLNISSAQAFIESYASKISLLIPMELIILGATGSRALSIAYDNKTCQRLYAASCNQTHISIPATLLKSIYIKNLLNTIFIFASIINVFLLLLYLA